MGKIKNVTKIDLTGLGLTETGKGKVALGLGSGTGTTLTVASGGTGVSSLADKSVLVTQDTGTDTVSTKAMSANGQLLIGGTSGPEVATLTQGANMAIANTDGSITLSAVNTNQLTNFTVAGDSGANQTIAHGNTFTLAGGTGISTVGSATDIVTINLDTVAVNGGGTGQTSYANGELLIGNTTGNTLAKGTITGDDGITVTNGASSIELAVDLKSNGGLVIESNKIAVDLGASSFTNTLAQSNIANSISHALGIGSIELGHADNTTISRSAEATIEVEGKEVITYNDSNNRDITISSSNTEYPVVTIENTTSDGTAGKLRFNKNGASPANDTLGTISFDGEDAGSGVHTYASIIGSIEESTAGSEGGKLQFNVASHDGGVEQGLLIEDGDADTELDVTIANGVNSSTTIAGSLSVTKNLSCLAMTSTGETFGMSNATSQKPSITLTSTGAHNKPSLLNFIKNRGGTSTSDDDFVMQIIASGYDDSNNTQIYGDMKFQCKDNTHSSEDGEFALSVASGATPTAFLTATGTGSSAVNVTLGAGTGSIVDVVVILLVTSDAKLHLGAYGNNDSIYSDGDSMNISMDDSDVIIIKDDQTQFETPIKILETAAAVSDNAGKGQIWVKNETPNELYFTNDAGNDIQLTSGSSAAGGGGTSYWHQTFGGYKSSNSSTTNYYMPYYPNNHSWNNYDSSPTTITYTDAYSAIWIAPAAGTLTKISIIIRGTSTDDVQFYVFKGDIATAGEATTGLTQIGASGAIDITASAETHYATASISSSNTFAAGDALYVMYKKEEHNFSTTHYFSGTISGEYS